MSTARPITDILADIHAYGYRITHTCEIRTGGKWHVEIGPWGFQTTGFETAFGRGETIEEAMEDAWGNAQKILPKITAAGDTTVTPAVADESDGLNDVLG